LIKINWADVIRAFFAQVSLARRICAVALPRPGR
jgi:hypothetical protein